MPQIAREEFDRLLLLVHTFLVGVPLHDVWAVDLRFISDSPEFEPLKAAIPLSVPFRPPSALMPLSPAM